MATDTHLDLQLSLMSPSLRRLHQANHRPPPTQTPPSPPPSSFTDQEADTTNSNKKIDLFPLRHSNLMAIDTNVDVQLSLMSPSLRRLHQANHPPPPPPPPDNRTLDLFPTKPGNLKALKKKPSLPCLTQHCPDVDLRLSLAPPQQHTVPVKKRKGHSGSSATTLVHVSSGRRKRNFIRGDCSYTGSSSGSPPLLDPSMPGAPLDEKVIKGLDLRSGSVSGSTPEGSK